LEDAAAVEKHEPSNGTSPIGQRPGDSLSWQDDAAVAEQTATVTPGEQPQEEPHSKASVTFAEGTKAGVNASLQTNRLSRTAVC
jgi:hypothetical protein